MNVAIGLPVHGSACRAHELCLAGLRRAEPSWLPILLQHASHIELSRAVIAEEARRRAMDVILWLDSDMVFELEAAREVVRQAYQFEAIVGCVYAAKSFGDKPRIDFLGSEPLQCIKGGGLVEVRALGFGVLAHPVSALDKIAEHYAMKPLAFGRAGQRVRRWFGSTEPEWDELMGEDYAFCRRARAAGLKVFADTRHRVGHVGEHVYHLEDGASPLPRYEGVEIVQTWPTAWVEESRS